MQFSFKLHGSCIPENSGFIEMKWCKIYFAFIHDTELDSKLRKLSTYFLLTQIPKRIFKSHVNGTKVENGAIPCRMRLF